MVLMTSTIQLLGVLRATARERHQRVHARHRHGQRPASVLDVFGDSKTSPQPKICIATEVPQQHTRALERRIREQLLGVELPPSSYDTAWVAMVPAKGTLQAPRFPRYVEWIMQNQQDDGSWGLGHLDPCLLGKDTISSTLACILALRTWSIGDEHIIKGLHFIGENLSRIMDDRCYTPVGFNIIFPGMIRSGIDMGLKFPIWDSLIDEIFRLREMELQREGNVLASGRDVYMAYVAEGLGDIQEWDQVLKYQCKNGSLFNSPSATAALAIHTQNASALKYLDFLGDKRGSSAPTVYPLDTYSHLCMLDTLEKMGISHHFPCEINCILETTYRSWMRKDDEIIMDVETCAMAFRILRLHGYDISSDIFSRFSEGSRYHDSIQGDHNDTEALLELYKVSQLCIFQDEWTLKNIGSWTKRLLEQQVCTNGVAKSLMPGVVEYALKFPFCSAIMEPLQHKRNIEHYTTKRIQMRKSAYLAYYASEDILALAIEEFHSSQSLYQQELQCIERWAKQIGLDRLKFARVMPLNVFVFMASTIFPSKLCDASIAWIQNSILTTVVDDFFDGGGSVEELKNLVALFEKWDAHAEIGFCSEDVEILFYAVYKTNNQIGAKAAVVQKRRVIDHIAEVWVNVVKAYMTEADWTMKRHVPTMEEYMPVAAVSIALGAIVAPSLYLVGPELSEDMVRSPEYRGLLANMCTSVRFLNDLGTYKKEMGQGYINSVLLKALDGDGVSTTPASIEAAKLEVWGLIIGSRRELLRLVLRDGGAIPRSCRDIFWNTYKMGHRFYLQGHDGFSMPRELVAAVNAVVHEPLQEATLASRRIEEGVTHFNQ